MRFTRASKVSPIPVHARIAAVKLPSPGTAADLKLHTPISLPISFLLGLLLLLAYSRMVELLPVPGVIVGSGSILLAYVFLTSRWTDALWNVPTFLVFGMTLWMLAASVAGLWPGGSLQLLMNMWSRSLLIYVLIVCLVSEPDGVRRTMAVIAFSAMGIACMSFWRRTSVEGRLAIDTGTLNNPNDLAMYLVFCLPFCAWYTLDRKRAVILRVIMAATFAYTLVLLLRTGSRMGMLAALALLLVLLAVVSWRARALLAMATFASVLCAALLLPDEIERRYLSMVSRDVESTETSQQEQFAMGSQEARWRLFVNSLRVTAMHPLLGVGPGNFGDANAQLTAGSGTRASWQQTHNSYTQVSSECGVPAGIAFLALVIYCLVHTNRIRKLLSTLPDLRAHASMGLCLLCATAGYAVCAAFGSVAYLIQLPLLCALTVALDRSFVGIAGMGKSAGRSTAVSR